MNQDELDQLTDLDLNILLGFQLACRERIQYPFLIKSATDLMNTNSAIIDSEKLSVYKYLDENRQDHSSKIYDLIFGFAQHEKNRNSFYILIQMILQIVFLIIGVLFIIRITF